VISGAKFGGNKFGMPELASKAFSKPIDCLSLHFIGTFKSLTYDSASTNFSSHITLKLVFYLLW